MLHGIAEARQQIQSRGADLWVVGVDDDIFKEGVDGRAQTRQRRHGPGKILGLDRHRRLRSGIGQRGDERGFGGFGRGVMNARRGPVFLLENISGAFVTGEQVHAVFGGDEGLERMDASEQADEIILAAERKHCVDEVMADAGFLLLHL